MRKALQVSCGGSETVGGAGDRFSSQQVRPDELAAVPCYGRNGFIGFQSLTQELPSPGVVGSCWEAITTATSHKDVPRSRVRGFDVTLRAVMPSLTQKSVKQ